MAFGIFKKTEERMAPPKAKAPGGQSPPARKPDSVSPASVPSAKATPVSAKAPPGAGKAPPPAKPPADDFDDLESLDFTGITIDEEKDPVDAAVEEAAVAFANGDAAHCEAVLRDSVKSFLGVPGAEQIWLMLFDVYRATGKREPFGLMELEYAKRFEKQPPVWRDLGAPAATAAAASGAIQFKGELLAANTASLEALAQAVEKSDKPRFDFSRVKEVDAQAADRLLQILARGKKIKHPVEMLGLDNLMKILDPRVKARDPGQGLWRLLLECHQQQGKQESFDEIALDFAVTFEVQPPEYVAPAAGSKKGAPALVKPVVAAPADGAFYLAGQLTGGGRIEGLEAYLAGQDKAVIDMSGVVRIDFACAGVLMTTLKPSCSRGLPITIRYPSYLVAALLRVVGIAELATIVNARH